MILYHATMNLDIVDIFTPRIPSNRFRGEDSTIKRVCVSSSIGGCLTAAPFGGSTLTDRIYLPNGSNRLIRIYEFDTSVISKNCIISPDYLYKNDIVRDAEVTGEHWITTQIKPSKSYLIKLTRYSDEYGEDDIEYKYKKMYEEGEIEDIVPYLDGFITVIDVIEYDIISEERRSKILRFNSLVNHNEGYSVLSDLDSFIDEFPYSIRTNLEVDIKDGKEYIVGDIDTRGAEIDTEELNDLLDYMTYGKITSFSNM